ncbi:MAG: c-type cytochrome [Candidatus Acidiferrales bacterium]
MMRNFFWGVIFTLIVIAIGGYLILQGGYVNFGADAPPSSLEKKIATGASDASIARHAPQMANPLTPTDENLLAGARLYRDNCAGCHGDPANMDSSLGDSFNPPAPAFLMDKPDMPEYQNFYIIRHGIRWSAMPSWKGKFNDTQTWQVVTLLSHIDKLPPAVDQELQKAPASTN